MQLRHAAPTATLGLAAASWVDVVWQMNGMGWTRITLVTARSKGGQR